MSWFDSNNGYQKDTHFKEIERCAQKMVIILGSIVNIVGKVYMTI